MEKNAAQEKAIHHNQGPMMLLAGPGSGKTTTMTRGWKRLFGRASCKSCAYFGSHLYKGGCKRDERAFLSLCQKSGVAENYQRVTFGTFHGIFYGILDMLTD